MIVYWLLITSMSDLLCIVIIVPSTIMLFLCVDELLSFRETAVSSGMSPVLSFVYIIVVFFSEHLTIHWVSNKSVWKVILRRWWQPGGFSCYSHFKARPCSLTGITLTFYPHFPAALHLYPCVPARIELLSLQSNSSACTLTQRAASFPRGICSLITKCCRGVGCTRCVYRRHDSVKENLLI